MKLKTWYGLYVDHSLCFSDLLTSSEREHQVEGGEAGVQEGEWWEAREEMIVATAVVPEKSTTWILAIDASPVKCDDRLMTA